MSWILLLTIVLMLVAVVLVELRAVRTGDEREHHAPGYTLVVVGLVSIASGIAMALIDEELLAVALSTFGLVVVGWGTTHSHERIGPHHRGQSH